MRYIRFFDGLSISDVSSVGGKNASLGEMIRSLHSHGVRVPMGFATTAKAFRLFLEYNRLFPRIFSMKGESARNLIKGGKFPKELQVEIIQAYKTLSKMYKKQHLDVAVRSSATAEDLPEASFAGQQERFLNIVGEKALLAACKKCYASLFTDSAIAYRKEKGFAHQQIPLSIGVQKMVRSDCGSSGVMFTIDTETGFPDVIVINGAFGLGENIVQGIIEPDQYMVYKPFLEKQGTTPLIEKMMGNKALKRVYTKTGTKNVKISPSEKGRFNFPDPR